MAVTGFGGVAYEEQAHEAGFHCFIAKPINWPSLRDFINNYCSEDLWQDFRRLS